MLSTKESVADTSFDGTMAMYKGLKVAVYIVDKTDLSLSGSDLIELINVCILLTVFIQSSMRIFLVHNNNQYRLNQIETHNTLGKKRSQSTVNNTLHLQFQYF